MYFSTMFVLIAFSSVASTISASIIARQDVKNTSTESAPNPIAQQYPFLVTGTINGTLTILPIPYSLARSIIPTKYKILKHAYQSLMPEFPRDSYPLVLRTCLDHDLQIAAAAFSLPDFQLTKLMFPFIDLLGDGYSSFTYVNHVLITETNTLALTAILDYGQTPVPATFTPLLEAYQQSKSSGKKGLSFTAFAKKQVAIETNFQPQRSPSPWPLAFYRNMTNQPSFRNGTLCINQQNFFNTTLSTGANTPAAIRGDVTVQAPYLPARSVFRDVWGIKVDVAFLENSNVPCEALKGYAFGGGQ